MLLHDAHQPFELVADPPSRCFVLAAARSSVPASIQLATCTSLTAAIDGTRAARPEANFLLCSWGQLGKKGGLGWLSGSRAANSGSLRQ